MKNSAKTFLIIAISFFAIIGVVMTLSSFKPRVIESPAPSSLTLISSKDGISIYRIGECYVARTNQGISIAK